jgi:phosphatidylglycerophosphate synthase
MYSEATKMSPVISSVVIPAGKNQNEFQSPNRIQLNLLSSQEKRILIWIAKRFPAQIHSDHLTILGFLGMILAGVSYALSEKLSYAPLLATLFLFLNWFGDSLDGTIARVRNKQRPRYGFYVDHALDTVGMLFLMTGLAVSQHMSPWISAGFLVAYYLISIEIYLSTTVLGEFKLSFGIMGPTEMRILLAIGNTVLFYYPRVHLFGREFQLFDIGFGLGIIALVVLTFVTMIRNTIRLYHLEPLSKNR